MDSYAAYRLTDWDWISRYKDKMGADQFRDYVNSVYSELMKMKVGGVFSLDSEVREENKTEQRPELYGGYCWLNTAGYMA